MSRYPRRPFLLVLAVALIAVGVVSSMAKNVDPSQLPSSLALNGRAESTALYCTGFSSTKLGENGRVIFMNTTAHAHEVTIDVVSDKGHSYRKAVTLGAYQQYGFDPSVGLTGDYFGVWAQVSGGGVVGVQVSKNHDSEAPCISTGVTNWFASGFDTTVGSSAILSVFNPTATPAVFNVSTFSSTGYVAPAKFQGYAVGPHSQAEIHLGSAIVNLSNIGVHVKVLRGSLDIVGLQQSGPTVSFNTGLAPPTTTTLFPLVTTANGAVAQVRLANPGPTPANVTLVVTLAPFHVPNQTVRVPPYGSVIATITPNSAIPVAHYASVALRANVPVIAALATGSGRYIALSAPPMPEAQYLVGDFTGHAYDAAVLTNTSTRAITVTITRLPRGGAQSTSTQVRLGANATATLRSVVPSLAQLRGVALIVSAPRASLLITLTLPTRPAGMTVVSALDGR